MSDFKTDAELDAEMARRRENVAAGIWPTSAIARTESVHALYRSLRASTLAHHRRMAAIERSQSNAPGHVVYVGQPPESLRHVPQRRSFPTVASIEVLAGRKNQLETCRDDLRTTVGERTGVTVDHKLGVFDDEPALRLQLSALTIEVELLGFIGVLLDRIDALSAVVNDLAAARSTKKMTP